MTRWFSKRWVWAALAGATVTVGMAAGGADGDGPPKVGAVVSLNIDGKGERQFKVVKSEKQSDGTYHSDLKDLKTGETITLVDKPGDTPPAGPKSVELPKAKPRTSDPLTPPVTAAMPDPSKEKEKRPVLGRAFGDKDKPAALPGATANAAPKAEPPADPNKKPGLLSRIFGPKKPTGPSMPASTGAPPAGPVLRPGTSVAPPPVLPVPPGGLSGTTPPVAPPSAGGTAPPSFPSTSTEPPRVMPVKPFAPPTPAVPAPLPIPAPAPAFAAPAPPPIPAPTPAPPVAAPTPLPIPAPAPAFVAPAPLPIPAPAPAPPVAAPTPLPALPVPSIPTPLPVPSIPSIPAPPGGTGLPPIPVPPGGMSAAKPIQVVVPVGYVPAGVAFDREVQPFAIALQSMSAPSARLTAAKGLAEGRHGSSDGVKGVLFQAAQMDPCGEVRAACIDHLCKLGYFSPHFLGYIQTACDDADPQVRDAAKAACAKMLRK